MPRELPYIAAIEEAIRQEMDRDETVLLFGQNIATTENDPFLKAFGHDRVRVTPISETAEIGMAGEGVSAEVIDLRALAPLDTATVIESVSKTGHLVLVDQATRHASASAVIAAEVADAGFGYLKAPIKQVTGLDTPIPYSKPMEEHVLPNEDKIVEAVRQVLSTTLVT